MTQDSLWKDSMKSSILVVEDDPVARMALTQTLESAGYSVQDAADGAIAIEMLVRDSFQLVLSDLRMPDVDGLDVLRAAAALQNPPAVVLLTGYSTVETAVAALRLGATDYLLKPVDPSNLLKTIAQGLKKRGDAQRQANALRTLAQGVADLQRQLRDITAPISEVGDHGASVKDGTPQNVIEETDLFLGRFPYEARYQGQPLHLTPIEHALLRCLAEAPEHMATYSEIVRFTHGYEADASEAQAMLKSHVRNLRRKTSAGLIANVRHVGYQLSLNGESTGDSDE